MNNCIYMDFFKSFEPENLREWIIWKWNKMLYKLGILRYVNIDIRQKSLFDGVGIKIHTDLALSMNQMAWYQYSSYPDDPSLVHFEALVAYDYDDGWAEGDESINLANRFPPMFFQNRKKNHSYNNKMIQNYYRRY